MHCVYVIFGNCLMFLITVFVGLPSCNDFVGMVGLPLFTIMNCVISQRHGCRRFVMMLLLNLPFNHLVVNLSLQLQLSLVMMLGQIFMQEVSGADDKVHFLILGFFILMHQADCIFISKT